MKNERKGGKVEEIGELDLEEVLKMITEIDNEEDDLKAIQQYRELRMVLFANLVRRMSEEKS